MFIIFVKLKGFKGDLRHVDKPTFSIFSAVCECQKVKKLNSVVYKQRILLHADSDSAKRLPKKLQNSEEKMSFFVYLLFVKVFFPYLSQNFIFFDKPIQRIIITAMRSLSTH